MQVYANPPVQGESVIEYRADSEHPERSTWKPSIHMPRWMARIHLQIKAIRSEKLMELSEADAVAEGVKSLADFKLRWTAIHGSKIPWHSNPDVWVIEFEKA